MPNGQALAADIAFPKLSGRVVDEAGVISGGTEQTISSELAALEKQTGHQLVLVTLASLQGQPIEDFGYKLGRHWGIGREEKNDGALLIVAPKEREVRIEVGYGLEGVLTDALSRIIIEEVIVPRFRVGDLEGGAAAGIAALIKVLGGDGGALEEIAPAPADDGAGIWNVIVIVIIVLLILFSRGGLLGFLLGASLGGRGGGRRRGGGFGGGGFGGGGFGGGGGGFGGGGATGRW